MGDTAVENVVLSGTEQFDILRYFGFRAWGKNRVHKKAQKCTQGVSSKLMHINEITTYLLV